jgi:hypothetical protein
MTSTSRSPDPFVGDVYSLGHFYSQNAEQRDLPGAGSQEVKSKPQHEEIKHIAENYSTEWLHLTMQMSYTDSQTPTRRIVTTEGKRQEITVKRSKIEGIQMTVETLVVVSRDQMIPQRTALTMQDLEINYIDPWLMLLELAVEEGWRKLAMDTGVISYVIKVIQKETCTTEQAVKQTQCIVRLKDLIFHENNKRGCESKQEVETRGKEMSKKRNLKRKQSRAFSGVILTNECHSVNSHPVVQSTVFERFQFEPENLCKRRAKGFQYWFQYLLPYADHEIHCFLPLILHLYIYARAERAGESPVDVFHQLMNLFLISEEIATQICCDLGLTGLTEILCKALSFMEEACELLTDLQTAEGYFKKGPFIMENCNAEEKIRISFEDGQGKILGCICAQQ